MDTTMDRDTLGAKLLPELQQIAQGMGVEGAQKLRKAGLIDAIVAASTNGGEAAKPTRAKRNGAAKTEEAPGGRGRQPGPGSRHAARDIRQRPWQPRSRRQPGPRRRPRR